MTNPQNTRRHEILAALPGASPDVVKATGAHRNVVNRWLTRLHQEGAIRIKGWIRWKGGPLPVYARGAGRDADCTIKPLTVMQRYNAFKEQAEADGRWDARNARINARAAADRAAYTRDPLLAALFAPRPSSGV